MAESFERWITSAKGNFWFRTIVFGTCTVGWLAWGIVQSSLTRIEAKQDLASAKIEEINGKLQGLDKGLALEQQTTIEHTVQINHLQNQAGIINERLVRVETASESRGKK